MQRISFGSITVDAYSDGDLVMPITAMFPDVPLEAFRAYGGVDENGIATAPLTTFVVRANGQTILVDTGMGPELGSFASLGFSGTVGQLPEALEGAGIAPEHVDAVFFTHLHGDHIGWNTRDIDGEIRPAFPNARYLVARAEWENRATVAPPEMVARSLTPVEAAGQLVLVEDGYELAPGVIVLSTPGHTPGHCSLLLSAGGEAGIITGDAAHHPAEMEMPDVKAIFDADPAQSTATRIALVERAEAEGLVVLGGHFPPPTAGRVVRVEQRRRWQWLGAQA